MKRAYADLSIGQMHYRYCGQGEPLIMVHFAGSFSDEYEEVGEMLKDKFTVYAIDLFGMGYSTKPDHKLSISEHAQTLIDFMDALNIKKAYLYGTLVGANICIKASIKCPDRVIKAIFTQPVYMEDYQAFKDRGNLPAYADLEIKDDGSHMMEIWKKADMFGYSAEINTWRARSLMIAGEFMECMHWAVFNDEDYNYVLPKVSVPCVVVKLGGMSTAENATLAAKLIPNAEIDEYEEGLPYHSKANPKSVADMVLKHFK